MAVNPLSLLPKILDTKVLSFDAVLERDPDLVEPFRPVSPGSTTYEAAAPGIGHFTFEHAADLPPIAAESKYWFMHNSDELLVGFWENGVGCFPPHFHPVIEHWTLITEGSIYIVTDEEALKLGPGDLLHLEPMRPHSPLVLPDQEYVRGIEICIPGSNYETTPLLEGPQYDKVADLLREIAAS